jgi:hypothetical protein
MPTDKYTENAVVNREGWTRIVDGGTTYYRSPGGVEISNRQYYKLAKDYPTPNPIPEDVVSIAAGINIANESLKSTPTKPAFMQGSTAPEVADYAQFPSQPNAVPSKDPSAINAAKWQSQQQQKQQEEEEPTRFRDNITDIGERTGVTGKNPKGRKTDARYKHPRATAQGLAQGFRKLFLLITTLVVAKILNDDRACMDDKEATMLGMALGNLLESTTFNENYGWLISETGDYQAIGYVLIMYVSRLNDVVQDKRRAAAGGQQARYSSSAPTAPPPSPNGAVRNNTPGAC